MLISLQKLLQHALKKQYAVPAFNVNFMEQAMAILDAAEETNSPVILQLSTGGIHYAPKWFFKALLSHAASCNTPVVIHRDHCHDLTSFQEAVDMGFTSIMMDGTLTPEGRPRTFDENVNITQQAMKIKPSNVSIEAEIGCLGSLESGLSGEEDGTSANMVLNREALLTDPQQAQEFVDLTGVDALAVAIGTSHGIHKFTKPPSADLLDINRVLSISKAIPKTPLVMHGSSSIPKSLCDMINQNGGAIPKTYGVPIPSIQSAIQHGITKVNIDTDLRLATTAAIRQALQRPDVFDPRAYLKPAYHMMKALCVERYIAFGCKDKALLLNQDHETPTT